MGLLIYRLHSFDSLLENACRVINLLRKYESKDVILNLHGFTIDIHTLLSINRMEELTILNVRALNRSNIAIMLRDTQSPKTILSRWLRMDIRI